MTSTNSPFMSFQTNHDISLDTLNADSVIPTSATAAAAAAVARAQTSSGLLSGGDFLLDTLNADTAADLTAVKQQSLARSSCLSVPKATASSSFSSSSSSSSSSFKTTVSSSSSSSSSSCSPRTQNSVGWSQITNAILHATTTTTSTSALSENSDQDEDENEKMDADAALCFQWSQLLIKKALHPHCFALCQADADLPDTNENDIDNDDEDDDFWKRQPAWTRVRNCMLSDGNLTPKETAAFWQGMKLMQGKCNSLQAQLEGLRCTLLQKRRTGNTHVLFRSSSSSRPHLGASQSFVVRHAATENNSSNNNNKGALFRNPSMPVLIVPQNNDSNDDNNNKQTSSSSSSSPGVKPRSTTLALLAALPTLDETTSHDDDDDDDDEINFVPPLYLEADMQKQTTNVQQEEPPSDPTLEETVTEDSHAAVEEKDIFVSAVMEEAVTEAAMPEAETTASAVSSRAIVTENAVPQPDQDAAVPTITNAPVAAASQRSSLSSNHHNNKSFRHFAQRSRSLRQMSIRRIQETTADNADIQKLLHELHQAEARQDKLEKQLAAAGVVIAQDIPYDEAKAKVQAIATRMQEIGGSDATDKKLQEEYFKLEQDMEKYTTALELTDEWMQEQEEADKAWEASIQDDNQRALEQVRRHMPVAVRNMSEADLHTQVTPNGLYLPKAMAKKFKRTNVLQLLRMDPADIIPMHAATLENLRVTGLTLTERRALYQHLLPVGPKWKAMQGDKMTQRKWTWYNMMKSNFKENVDSWQRHVDRYGPPDNHPYASRDNLSAGGCPMLGNHCPLKADRIMDYSGDYGFPAGPEYFKSEIKKSDVDNVSKAKQDAQEALKQKKAEERRTFLKEHYKGKILQVSLANGSCEAMDDSMSIMESYQEKWTKARVLAEDDMSQKEVSGFNEALNGLKLSILQLAERSGMQLTGKRDASVDHPDIRSMIEVSLSEEVVETAQDFFQGIEERVQELDVHDGRLRSTIQQLKILLHELHDRNLQTIEALGGADQRPPRSREFKSRAKIAAQVEKECALEKKKAQAAAQPEPQGPPSGGRGDFLSSISQGRAGRGGGRGDLLSALQGRGSGSRGSSGRGGDAGRGDLLTALQGRRAGRGDRGDLMAALQGRGAGRGRGSGPDPMQSALMAAIAGRGKQ